MLRNRLPIILPDLVVIACCLVSLGLSVIESRVNTDAHHWGLMYGTAADFNQGLVPYRETFIYQGFLTTLIQSFSLSIFGNTVVSVGIITGIFYAINIYLSYCLWQKILNKWLSSISAVLMFLVHGYIIYPWSNYFSYTFLLGSILFITSSPQKQYKYLLAGVFAGFSLLARQSLLPILAPFYLYFLLIFFVSSKKEFWQLHFKNILAFHLGLIVVFGAFFIYLIQESAVRDWYAQTFTILRAFKSVPAFGDRLLLLKSVYRIILGREASMGGRSDARTILYSLILLNALITCLNIFLTARKKEVEINERDKILFLFSSVILLGYLNVIHLYNLFRLQSSSSLGLGLLVLCLHNLLTRFRQWKKLFFTVPVVCLFLYLSQTLVFTKTSSADYPWNRTLLLNNQLKHSKNIEILKGKLFDENTRNYYQILSETMTKYSFSCQIEYVVNFSMNSYIPFLTKSIKKVQRSPGYYKFLEDVIFQDEKEKIAELLRKEQAILVASDSSNMLSGSLPDTDTFKQIPDNYQVILELPVPGIPYTGTKTYIAVPKNLNCQN